MTSVELLYFLGVSLLALLAGFTFLAVQQWRQKTRQKIAEAAADLRARAIGGWVFDHAYRFKESPEAFCLMKALGYELRQYGSLYLNSVRYRWRNELRKLKFAEVEEREALEQQRGLPCLRSSSVDTVTCTIKE